jgi:hypothetical protein
VYTNIKNIKYVVTSFFVSNNLCLSNEKNIGKT